MLLVPQFFVRTSFRILLFQSFLAWLWIHLEKAPLPGFISLAIGATIGASVNTLKITLDNNLGFALPWDAPYFLPSLLDEYILATMPDLAILLGEPPCSTRIARLHPETKSCERSLAFACQKHAIGFEAGKLELEFLRACYEDYGIDTSQALQHERRCHKQSEVEESLRAMACIRAKHQVQRTKEVCFYVPPEVDCLIQYSLWKPPMRGADQSVDKQSEEGVCDSRVFGDMYIVNRFRGFRLVANITTV